MTNGEKIQTIIDVDRDCTEVYGENGTMTFTVTQDFWNTKYKEPKTGHWIATNDYVTTAYGTLYYYRCSCCGEDSLEDGDFCPNCGAKMESEG